jgi:hypothetical protein
VGFRQLTANVRPEPLIGRRLATRIATGSLAIAAVASRASRGMPFPAAIAVICAARRRNSGGANGGRRKTRDVLAEADTVVTDLSSDTSALRLDRPAPVRHSPGISDLLHSPGAPAQASPLPFTTAGMRSAIASLAAARECPAKHPISDVFTFGKAYGVGVLTPLGVPMTFIAPAAWKRALGVPAAKK